MKCTTLIHHVYNKNTVIYQIDYFVDIGEEHLVVKEITDYTGQCGNFSGVTFRIDFENGTFMNVFPSRKDTITFKYA